MKTSFSCHALTGLAVALLCPPLLQAGGELAHGGRGIVATVHPLATDAAVETFKNGGNAIDAAVAAALTLGIVDGHNSGIGGGCFMLIRLADGRFVAIDGREAAPAGATRDMFVWEGKADPELSLAGPLAAGVPALNEDERWTLEPMRLRLADRAAAALIRSALRWTKPSALAVLE